MSARGRVLVVPQAFKGSHSVLEVGEAVSRAVRDAGWIANVLPGSDGGDGLLEALRERFLRLTSHRVTGADRRPVEALVGWLAADEAVAESRLVCGLSVVGGRPGSALDYTTAGVGELISGLAAEGAARVYVGLGGSATVDGGLGMAAAWGFSPRDRGGNILEPAGRFLENLVRLDPGKPPPTRIVALADVNNRFTGPDGAIVYAPQKGVSADEMPHLMEGFNRLVEATAPLGGEVNQSRPGSGAAGGLGFGILTFAGGTLERGADWVLSLQGLDGALEEADLVMTCEAGFDRTSLAGKLTGTLLERAQDAGKPVILLAPRASNVPDGVMLHTAPGFWTLDDIYQRALQALTRC